MSNNNLRSTMQRLGTGLISVKSLNHTNPKKSIKYTYFGFIDGKDVCIKKINESFVKEEIEGLRVSLPQAIFFGPTITFAETRAEIADCLEKRLYALRDQYSSLKKIKETDLVAVRT